MSAVEGLRVLGEEFPLARAVLRVLRDESTGYEEFRRFMRIAGTLLALSVSRDLSWSEAKVRTPLAAEAVELEPGRPLYLVGVLGASIPLLEGFLDVYQWARIALVAARRVEEGEGVEIKVSYLRLPKAFDGDVVVVDPMLATGKTAEAAVALAKERGAGRVVVASVISSRQGVEYLLSRHREVAIHTLALDPELDDRYFIVPGLGDAGDRALGVSP